MGSPSKTLLRKARIFLVEDSHADAFLISHIFEELDFPHELLIARDGQEAIDLLTGYGDSPSELWPDFVLLDLNLPRRTGAEVLLAVKQHPRLSALPVIIFSSSTAPADIRSSYENWANGYVAKPVDLGVMFETLRRVKEFWIDLMQLQPC